jgi:hypothetical protein
MTIVAMWTPDRPSLLCIAVCDSAHGLNQTAWPVENGTEGSLNKAERWNILHGRRAGGLDAAACQASAGAAGVASAWAASICNPMLVRLPSLLGLCCMGHVMSGILLSFSCLTCMVCITMSLAFTTETGLQPLLSYMPIMCE